MVSVMFQMAQGLATFQVLMVLMVRTMFMVTMSMSTTAMTIMATTATLPHVIL